VLPIPGTTNRAHLRENLGAQAVTLSPEVLAQLDALFAPSAISGNRYGAQSQSEVDTEQY
jgi:aryl-alcohol dehydrogenase-like predicted oxidoreductase